MQELNVEVGAVNASHDNHIRSWQTSNWATVDHGVLNLALIVALVDLEETCISPVLVPAVRDKPIICTILGSPAHDFDGMATKHRICNWIASLVHTRLVRFETLVNEEHASNGTILINVLHHTVNTCRVVCGVALC